MSPIDFDTLAAERPDLAPVWRRLRDWFGRHAVKGYTDLPGMVRAFPDLNPLLLLDALRAMADAGMVRSTFKVKAPSGELLAGDFDDPSDIPDELPDRFHSSYVNTADGEVVPGFKWDEAHAEA